MSRPGARRRAPIKALALIGMMGSGKSTLAPLIAERIGCVWEDLDDCVQRAVKKSIAEVFEQDGEAAFRLAERDQLTHLVQSLSPPYVLATGGGVIVTPENRRRLRDKFWVVWLDAPADVLFARAYDGHRPLTRQGFEAFARLGETRRPLYDQTAHVRLDVAQSSAREVSEHAVQWWKERMDEPI